MKFLMNICKLLNTWSYVLRIRITCNFMLVNTVSKLTILNYNPQINVQKKYFELCMYIACIVKSNVFVLVFFYMEHTVLQENSQKACSKHFKLVMRDKISQIYKAFIYS